MTDAQIETAAEKAGAIWNGSNWMFEDADLHPFVRTVLAVERERWRGFTAHCQRVAAALKAQMTAEQVVAHLDAKMAESIDRMTSGDSSDLDPDLVEWAAGVLGSNLASSDNSEPGMT